MKIMQSRIETILVRIFKVWMLDWEFRRGFGFGIVVGLIFFWGLKFLKLMMQTTEFTLKSISYSVPLIISSLSPESEQVVVSWRKFI